MTDTTQTQVPQSLLDQFKSIQEQANNLFTSVNQKGVTDNSGNVLLGPGMLSNTPGFNLSPTIDRINYDNIQNQSLSSVASATSQDEFIKAQQAQYQQQQEELDAARAKQAGYQNDAQNWMNTRTNTQDFVDRQMQQYGIPQQWTEIQNLIPQINTLNQQLVNMQNAEMVEVDKIQNNPQYSVQYASRESGRVSREYAIRQAGVSAELGVKTMLMQTYQGNIATARNLVNDIVSAMQYEDNLKLTSINSFMDNNQNFISSLTSSQQTILNDIQSYWADKTTQEKNDYTNKTNLVVEYGLNLTANDIKTMSYDEIASMAAREENRRQLVSETNKDSKLTTNVGYWEDLVSKYIDEGNSPGEATSKAIQERGGEASTEETNAIFARAQELYNQKQSGTLSGEDVSTNGGVSFSETAKNIPGYWGDVAKKTFNKIEPVTSKPFLAIYNFLKGIK